MAKPESDIPIPPDQRGRYKTFDRLDLETLYASPIGTSMYFPFPAKVSRLTATAYAIGGPGWYKFRREGLGVRVWKIVGEVRRIGDNPEKETP